MLSLSSAILTVTRNGAEATCHMIALLRVFATATPSMHPSYADTSESDGKRVDYHAAFADNDLVSNAS
jgi:hypothetical protein